MFSKSSINQKRFLLVFSLVMFFSIKVNAQDFVPFTIEIPTKKVSNSLYNEVTLIDKRIDTVSLGLIQQEFVYAIEPLSNQFKNITTALIDDHAKQQSLILQLRKLNFSTGTSTSNKNVYISFKATLFTKTNKDYQKVNSIDTVVTITDATPSNKKILKKASETIVDFFASSLIKDTKKNNMYSYNEVFKIDSLEKSKLKLYTTNNYIDGIYNTFQTFRDQTPDSKINVVGNEINKTNVKMLDSAGVWRKIKPLTIYAIVYKGKPYVATEFGYYALTKTNNDFSFIGKGKTNTGSNYLNVGSMYGAIGGLLGAVGGSIIAASQKSTFEMRIDYNTGQIVRLREIEEEIASPSTTSSASAN